MEVKTPGGFGLGLRYSFAEEVLSSKDSPDWFEIAPENWMGRGGFFRKTLERVRERFPLVCHGLSLSIGSPDELNYDFLKALRNFLEEFTIDVYSEHLSFSSLGGEYLHDLFPLPFTENVVRLVSEKVQVVQDYLGCPLVLENISYYYTPLRDMEEWEFINAVLEESGALMLLDVNNVYVNSVNHGYDPYRFIDRIPLGRVAYIHIAGHERAQRILIDTHGEEVRKEVLALLRYTLGKRPNIPVLLERDNNIPPYGELLKELKDIERSVNAERV
ncbi:DUF692 domain-containing protein [Hydrogenivirga sp.]